VNRPDGSTSQRTAVRENPIDRHDDPDAFSVSASMDEPANRQIRVKMPRDARPGEWYPMTAKRAELIGSLLVAMSGLRFCYREDPGDLEAGEE